MTRTPSHDPVSVTRNGDKTASLSELRPSEKQKQMAHDAFVAREMLRYLTRPESSLDEAAKISVITETDKFLRSLGDLTRGRSV